MKKSKLFLSLLTILTIISSSKVWAFTQNATGFLHTDYSPSGLIFPNYTDSHRDYKDHKFSVLFNNKQYDAYCIDPGKSFNSAKALECSPVDNSLPQMKWLANNLTGNHLVDQLAVRMLSVYVGLNKNTTSVGNNIVRYLQLRDANNPEEAKKYLAGNEAVIEQAFNLANAARTKTNQDIYGNSGNLNLSQFRSLGMTKTWSNPSSSSYEATILATVEAPLGSDSEINNFNFSCSSCEVQNLTRNVENNGSKLIFRIQATIKIANPKCSYQVNLQYNGLGNMFKNSAYMCQSKSNSDQNLLAVIPETDANTTSGQVLDTYSESITASNGGSYYATYCDNSATETTCDQKTTVTKPAFCDDSNDETMNITSPDNIKGCILKEEDEAGNTYKMISNKYCSVYCKEDYEMTLPGAQFTTSGRYFKTRNVTVNGTKTCYTTSPDAETNDNVTNIDIAQFISDVKNKQNDLMNYYNNYQRQVAIRNLRNSNSSITSTTSTCDSNTATMNYLNGYITYTKITSLNCDNNTGRCTANTQNVTESYSESWGSSYGSRGGSWNTTGESWVSTQNLSATNGSTRTVCSDPENDGSWLCENQTYTLASCDSTLSNKSEPNWDGAVNDAASAMASANNSVMATINEFSSCYNWNTNYCFEPNVNFDYQEQYSDKINFEKVSGTVNNNASVSGNNNKTIDNAYSTNTGAASESVGYLSVDTSGIKNNNTATNISTLNTHIYHIKKVANATADYQNKQSFQTNYPHGTIDTVADASSLRKNYSYLGAIFPVAMNTEYGVYNWTLKFDNLGQYMNENSCNHLGRLDSVAGSLNTNLGYVCVYVVDCPECEFSCACPSNLADGYTCIEKQGINGTYCIIEPPCEGQDCSYECVGAGCNFCTDDEEPCIITTDEKYTYRSVSLNDLFPNNRESGANWKNAKGALAQSEIEQKGDEAYITPQYSYKLTAENMKQIRDRNKSLSSFVDGDGLTFQKLGDYNNFFATSKFLDDGDRLGYFTTLKRDTVWTIYPGTIGKGIGPAWK